MFFLGFLGNNALCSKIGAGPPAGASYQRSHAARSTVARARMQTQCMYCKTDEYNASQTVSRQSVLHWRCDSHHNRSLTTSEMVALVRRQTRHARARASTRDPPPACRRPRCARTVYWSLPREASRCYGAMPRVRTRQPTPSPTARPPARTCEAGPVRGRAGMDSARAPGSSLRWRAIL